MTLLAAAALLLVGGALAAGSGLLRLPTVVPPVPAPSVVAVATASPDATSPGPSESAAPSASPIPVAGPGGVWIPTGSMVTPRSGHTAVRLLDGRVLVVGGRSGAGDNLTSAELYDPATGTWSATGKHARSRPVASLPRCCATARCSFVGTSDGDPHRARRCTTRPAGPGPPPVTMVRAVCGTATLLRDGRVLVAGWDAAPRCTTRPAGPGPPPGRRTAQPIEPRPPCCPMARCSLRAAAASPPDDYYDGLGRGIRPRHGVLDRDREHARAHGDLGTASCSPMARCWWWTHECGSEVYDPATGTWTALACRPSIRRPSGAAVGRHRAGDRPSTISGGVRDDCTAAACTTHGPGR